jgi:phage gpG-like protein
MIKLKISVPGLEQAVDRLTRVVGTWGAWRRPTLTEAQRIMREAVESAMTSGGYPGHTWAPRSEVSEKLRPGGGMQNLVSMLREDVTQTTASLRLELTAGSFLSEGGDTAAGSMIPGKTVPARPLMMISDPATRRIRDRQRENVLALWS